MPPLEYARAFALNFVFFAAALVIYAVSFPADALQIGLLLALSITFTVRRVRLLRVVQHRLAFEDREAFLHVLDHTISLKDRWECVRDDDEGRRYETRLHVGLYFFQAFVQVDTEFGWATLTGQQRSLYQLADVLVRAGVAAPM